MKKLFLCSALLGILTGCSTIKNPIDHASTQAKHPPMEEKGTVIQTNQPIHTPPNHFTLSAAIAAKSHQKGWSAIADWRQSDARTYQITLIGPMGSQAVRIEEQHGTVTYIEGKQTFTASNGDQLLAKKTGIHLPVTHLYYWVRGIPAPGTIQAVTRNSTGQILTLKQSGYSIEFTDYMQVQNYVLPHKMRLSGKDLTVKLVIKKWQV